MTAISIQNSDTTASGSITTQNLVAAGTATASSAVEISLSNKGTVSIQITGTYTGTLTPQVTTNGTNWVTLSYGGNLQRSSNSFKSDVIPSGDVGIWEIEVTGHSKFRLTALGTVTGTASITLRAAAGVTPQTNPDTLLSKTAFGDLQVAEKTPIVQVDFRDNIIRNRFWKTLAVNGTATASSSLAVLQTTAAANSYVSIQSLVPVKYNAGQGGEAEFTAIFDTPVAGCFQEIGIGDFNDGLFLGYQGTTFGTIRRCPERNRRAITSLTSSGTVATVTTTAEHSLTTGDMVQITGNISTPNNENPYIGAYIITVTGASTFTYVLSTTTVATATGTFKFDKIIDTITPQASWNSDTQLGDGKSQQTLVHGNGNIYKITFQYLGFGMITFSVETKETGALDLVDTVKYANTSTTTTLSNPTLPLYVGIRNTTNTTNKTIKTASMAGFIQGKNQELSSPPFNKSNTVSGITTEVPILSIQNKRAFNGEINKNRIKLANLNLYADGTGTNSVTFKLILNATLTGASFSDIDNTNSSAAASTSATALTGGTVLKQFTIGRNTSTNLPEIDINLYLNPEDVLTISCTSSSTIAGSASINWRELI